MKIVALRKCKFANAISTNYSNYLQLLWYSYTSTYDI